MCDHGIGTKGKPHRQALRQVANRLVGIIHVRLERGALYPEAGCVADETERHA